MDCIEIIKASKIIAIARGIYDEELLLASRALYDAGVRAFEVTFKKDQPAERTEENIRMLVRSLPDDAVIGAGTVLEPEQADAAFRAGAGFIISPNTDADVIARTKELGMVSIPGAMTPSEIVTAFGLGGDIIKLFPAGILGPEYFKAVKTPLEHIPLAAVAGVTNANIRAFSQAGAEAFGISSSLYIPSAIKKGDYGELTKAALEFYNELI